VARNGMIGVGPLLPHHRIPAGAARGSQAPPRAARPRPRFDFYRRRVRRIVPAYYVHLLFLFLVALPLLRGLEFWRYNTAYVLENLSAHILSCTTFRPATSASLSINGALWTLALEAQFYLLAASCWRRCSRARPWRTATALFGAAIAWHWLAANHLDPIVDWMRAIEPRWNISESAARHLLQTQLPGYLGHFAAGMLAGRAWMNWRGHPPTRAAAAGWIAAAAASLVLLWMLHSPGGWILGQWTWALALAALTTAFVALVARGIPLAQPLLANRPLAFVGRISYSAYLYHLPLLLLWNAYAPQLTGSPLGLPLYLAAVIAVAWLSYRRIELAGNNGVRLQLS
jgi:peptidoglycan/LPS O-acetylase OafA/YrhL